MKQVLSIVLVLLGIGLDAQIPNSLSPSEKVYGLSKFWQETNYNFIYLNQIDRDRWNATYRDLIARVQETENDYEYYRLLKRFCASLNDGHTNVFFPDNIERELQNTYFGEYRLFVKNINGRAIVMRTNLSKKDELPIGTEITHVNGRETKTYLENKVLPCISSSTEHARLNTATWKMFKAPKGTTFDITFRLPSGETKQLSLTHEETTEKEVFPAFEEWTLFESKWIKEDIAYLSLNSFSDPAIDSLFLAKLPELYRAKKLIIDLRKNGGGSTTIGVEILKYLTNDTILLGSKELSRLHIPAFKAWGAWTEPADTVGDLWATQAYRTYRDNFYHTFPNEPDTFRVAAKRLVVPTVLLIGHNTASAAEDFLIYADTQDHMIKIGEPTIGSTGQPMLFDLPGGGSARICTKKDTYPDGRAFVGVGILPDVQVDQSLEDFLADRDAALEEAIRYLDEH